MKKNKSGTSRKEPVVKQVEVENDAAELPVEKVVETDPVFIQYGPPFISEGNKAVVNQRAVAVKCAQQHRIKYDETLKVFLRFDANQGLWVAVHEVHVCRLFSNLLNELGVKYDHVEVVRRIKPAELKSLCEMLKIYSFECEVALTTGLFHASNGILNLRGDKPDLLPHDPKYPFTISSGIHFDLKAKCPRFLDDFLRKALSDDDIELIQKYCGSMLLGPNACHGILLIRGTPGGGKSTIVSIIEKMISETNVAYLRTKHLNGRFETSAFLGKRVLVGKDVPGDTLSVGGASLLKSLVGGDLLQAEIKYNATKQKLRGDFHVVIASNTNLRIALDGDVEAWRRRLLVVDFERKKTARPISNYAELLVAEEASGILSWLVEGAMKFKREMDAKGALTQSKKQLERVDSLLKDSDSVDSFIEQRLIEKKSADVSSEELLVDYHGTCNHRGWKAVSGQEFKRRVPDLICHRFLLHRRHDIMRDGNYVRGYTGLALR